MSVSVQQKWKIDDKHIHLVVLLPTKKGLGSSSWNGSIGSKEDLIEEKQDLEIVEND